MPAPVRTCLWFEKDGLQAAEFYVSLLPDSRIEGGLSPEPGKPPLVVNFTLGGAPFQILNGGPQFPQTEAVSISVTTADQVETDQLWDALVADGGREGQCGWCKDRFGVSWQIVPQRAAELFSQPDRAAAGRAMEAMMGMRRLDVAALEAAAAAA